MALTCPFSELENNVLIASSINFHSISVLWLAFLITVYAEPPRMIRKASERTIIGKLDFRDENLSLINFKILS